MSKQSNNTALEVFEALDNCESPLVIGHINPDGDAYGACCAVVSYLKGSGKQVTLYNESPLSKRYSFVPLSNLLTNDIPDSNDLIIVCDCGDIKRVGDSILDYVKDCKQIVNIDHHVSNNSFGSINIVQPKSSSTCEILFELFVAAKKEISPEIATALLIGIIFDTGSFRYSATSARTLQVASELISLGANLYELSSEIFSTRSIGEMKLEAYAISRMELHYNNKLALALVDEEHYQKCGATPEDADNIVDMLRDIKGVQVSVAIRRSDDLWRVSLRSKSDRYDVSEIASQFGGGGHKAAAAFRSRHDIKLLKPELIKRFKEVFEN